MAAEKELSADELWSQAAKDRNTDAPNTDVSPAVEIPEGAAEPAAQAMDDAPDPLAGLPEPTRKLIESLQTTVAEQGNRFKEVGQQLAKAHGTIGSLKQQLDASRPTLDELAEQRRTREEAAAAEKASKRDTLRSEIPEDFAEYVDLMIADVQPAASAPATPAITQVQEPVEETEAEKARREVTEEALNMIHPGWVEDVRGKEFKEWTKAQPNDVQALITSESVKDAAAMIGMFRKYKKDASDLAAEEQQRQARLRRGEIVQGRSSGQSGTDPAADSLWEKAKRDRAKRLAA